MHVADLLEAEGRALRHVLARFGLGLGLGILAAILAVAGVVGLLTGMWIGIATQIGPAWAWAIIGLLSLLLAGGLLAVAGRMTK